MQAVVFDLFGTLTDPRAEIRRQELVARTAAELQIPADAFWLALSGTFGDRIVGGLGDTRQTLAHLAERCGARPDAEQLGRAVAVHRDVSAELHRPRSGALEVLDELRRRGFRLGLISDCSSEICERWEATPYAGRLDTAVLSYQEGCRKPDPRLYAAAAARLGVEPGSCWYVGDGGSREHAGAARAGMLPVLVANGAVPEAAQTRDDPDDYRPELVIEDIVDVLGPVRWPGEGSVGSGDDDRVRP